MQTMQIHPWQHKLWQLQFCKSWKCFILRKQRHIPGHYEMTSQMCKDEKKQETGTRVFGEVWDKHTDKFWLGTFFRVNMLQNTFNKVKCCILMKATGWKCVDLTLKLLLILYVWCCGHGRRLRVLRGVSISFGIKFELWATSRMKYWISASSCSHFRHKPFCVIQKIGFELLVSTCSHTVHQLLCLCECHLSHLLLLQAS